jgi:surface antigen
LVSCVSPAGHIIGRDRSYVASCARAACLALSFALAGCSAIPLPSFIGSRQDVTGSINPANAISSAMDMEDWRRARGAMGLALDPQGNGEPVAWDNPKSGAKGVFTPVGPAKPVDERICRAFIATVGGALPPRALQGSACRSKDGEWAIGEVAPWTGAKSS